MTNPTILFLTNCELGQATVCLAVAHEFLVRKSYNVHIASSPLLETAITNLNSRAASLSQSAPSTATFHPITGRSMVQAITATQPYPGSFTTHEIGFWGALNAYPKLMNYVVPWTADEYIASYYSAVEIIQRLKPSLIAVDPLFAQGFDACRHLQCEYVVLSPNTLKDHVVQPMLGNLWKYPILCSGYSYPLPWKNVFANAYLAVNLGVTFTQSPIMKSINERRHAEGIQGPYPAISTSGKNAAQLLLASHEETDFPSYIPENTTLCGPILRPCTPIDQEFPELAAWLSGGPTVLVNLGSIVCLNEIQAWKLASGLRVLLDARPDIQVLWKLKPSVEGNIGDWISMALRGIIEEVKNCRVRIEEWLPVDPFSILQTGRVVCVVHHGGANSYNEAMRAGVPQIILPTWFDTFDFAARVEYLGVGVWGSKLKAPAIHGPELGEALIRVLHSEEGTVMREKARSIASKLLASEGRVVACEKMIELLEVQELGDI
ncbi:hypothetical protein BJX99DRAFT_231662 [Aspergillus californicus]